MPIIRLPAVKAETGHRSNTSIYAAVNAGLFTKPVRIGERSVGWPSDEVQTLNAARIAGRSEAEIRGLVDRLHAERAGALEAAEARRRHACSQPPANTVLPLEEGEHLEAAN